MNIKMKQIWKNLSYTLSANFLTLVVQMLLLLIVPKTLGVAGYSCWQLYTFYLSYVGLFHFGWIDGLYLKHGGQKYEELDGKSIGSQFWLLLLFEFCLAVCGILLVQVLDLTADQRFILIFTCLSGAVTIGRSFILYLLQATNCIRLYARLTKGDRYLYSFLVISYLLAIQGRNFQILIALDFFSRFVLLVLSVWFCRTVLFAGLLRLTDVMKEVVTHIRVGSQLLIGNLSSQLVIGVTRFGIQEAWNVETFGKVSLTLNLSNIALTFVNAVAIMLYPLLRRVNEKTQKMLFMPLRSVLVALCYGALLSFWPIKIILLAWLPKYAESFAYMGILFPIFIYEARIALFNNTYLKTLRKEKIILTVNVFSLLISVLLTGIGAFYLHNLLFMLLLILSLTILRCNLGEWFLTKALYGKGIRKPLLYENGLTIIFILSQQLPTQWLSIVGYLIVYLLYLVAKRRDLISSINTVKTYMRN